jgi:GT2 family glycosyltransferase
MHVAVVIVSYRGRADVERCLAGLAQSRYADWEVVICENGGPAALADLNSALPAALAGGQSVRVIDGGGNIGFAGGVNRGMAASAEADAWWVLNPDTAPGRETLGALTARLQAGDCDMVGNTVYLPGGVVQSHGGRWRKWLARAISMGHGSALDAPASAREIEARQNYVNGASMLVSRRFLERVGPMREDYFLYCEEVEWCLRARSRGLRLGFAAGAPLFHQQGTATGHAADPRRQSRLSVYLNERNRLLLSRDCYPLALPVCAAASLALLGLRFGRRRAWRQLAYALEGWLAGLAGERGPPSVRRVGIDVLA